MKTDHIFYRIFKDLPETFFALWGEDIPGNANDYRFDSVELKQTAFRIDGVFLPIINPENPTCFTEVQFQKDLTIFVRFLSEVFTYLRENKPDLRWCGMIIFRSRSLALTDRQREPVQPLLDSPLIKCIYLDELEVKETDPIGVRIIQLVVAKKKQLLETATGLIAQVKQQFTDEASRLELLNLLEVIILAKLPKMSRKELEAMFGVDDLRKTAFAQELKLEGIREGKLEGIREGKLEGIREGKLQAIPQLLKREFSPQEIADILELDVVQVEEFIRTLN